MENYVLTLQKSDLVLEMFDAQNVSHIPVRIFTPCNKIRISAIFYKKKPPSLSMPSLTLGLHSYRAGLFLALK